MEEVLVLLLGRAMVSFSHYLVWQQCYVKTSQVLHLNI